MWRFWWIPLLLALASCGGHEDPKAEVKAFISRGEELVEARDMSAAVGMVSPDYQDRRGNDQKAIKRLLFGYFLRHQVIHLFVQIEQLDIPSPDQAEVVLLAGMAGRPNGSLEGLLDLRADLYRFHLDLRKRDGDWLLIAIDWEPARRR